MDKEIDLPMELNKDPAKYFEMALNTIQEVMGLEITPDQESRMLIELGRIWDLAGNHDRAIEKYYEALKICRSDEIKAEIFKQIGNIRSKQSRFEEAQEAYEKSINILVRLGKSLEVGDIYNKIGFNCFEVGNFTKAKEYYDQALKISEELGNRRLLSDVLNNIGILMSVTGNKEQAIEYYSKSIKGYESISDKHGLAQTYHNLALTYTDVGQLELAGELYQKSMRLCVEIGDMYLLPVIYVNRAKLALKVHDTYMAMNYCDKARIIFEKTGNKLGLSEVYKIYGAIYSYDHRWEYADEAFQKGLEFCDECSSALTKAEIYYEMAGSFLKRQNNELGIQSMQRAIEIYEQLGMHKEVTKIKLELEALKA